jgi:hypothetical protein
MKTLPMTTTADRVKVLSTTPGAELTVLDASTLEARAEDGASLARVLGRLRGALGIVGRRGDIEQKGLTLTVKLL